MKKFILLLTIILSINSLSSQKTTTKQFRLSNNTNKKVKIHTPKGYDTDTIFKYPVVIVLGDDHLFDLAVGSSKLLAKYDLAPKQIIVGIPTNQKENRDVSLVKKTLSLTTNAKAYYKFIKNDLLKYMKAVYKVSPFNTIIGDDDAAIFATYFLKEQKPLFNSFICLNPTLSQDGNKAIKNYKLSKLGSTENTYFLYISSSPYKNDVSKAAFKQLKEGLIGYRLKNLKLEFDESENSLNAVSNIGEGIIKGFSKSFYTYRSISDKEYEEKIKDLDPLGAIEYLEKKYLDIDYLFGTNLNVRLRDFYKIEGIVSDEQGGDYLRVLGDFALIKHPTKPLGDYYMGKFYELGKDYRMADSYYKTGYGKLDPKDPMMDSFYQNIKRIQPFLVIKEKPTNTEEEPIEENEGEE